MPQSKLSEPQTTPQGESRRWPAWLASLLFFLCLDIGGGTFYFRLTPENVGNAQCRAKSPLYHHDLKRGCAGWTSWGSAVHRIYTNSLGFKDSSTREVPLASAAWRVILIGDSFTEGIGYPYEDTFAGILRARLEPRGVDVLNAAVSSYSPVIYYRKLKYLVEDEKLDVDEVIVFLDISDIEDEARHYELNADGNVVDQSVEAVKRFDPSEPPPPLKGMERFKRMLREHSLLAGFAGRLRDHMRADREQKLAPGGTGPLGPWSTTLAKPRGNWTHDADAFADYGETGLRQAGRSMDLLRDLLQRHGIYLTVVVYPWPNQIAARDRDSIQVRYWKDWAASRGAGFIDLFGLFMDGRAATAVIPAYFIAGDIHFNAEGHQRVAEAVMRQINPGRRPLGPAPPKVEGGDRSHAVSDGH